MEPYIKSYEPSDAAGIAQMWNGSNEGWPGGFIGGVPVTEERVCQWLSEDKPIDVFLAVADKRVVAYCSVYEYAAEPSAAYVSLLNCHPRYWGRGLGRDLLRCPVAHGETGTCVAMVAGAGSDKIVAIDYGLDGAHLYNTSLPVITPHASCEMVSHIVLISDVAEARTYRWLECVPWS